MPRRGEDGVVYLDQAEAQASVHSPTYLAAVWEKHAAAWSTRPAWPPDSRAGAEERGVEIFERSHVTGARHVRVRASSW